MSEWPPALLPRLSTDAFLMTPVTHSTFSVFILPHVAGSGPWNMLSFRYLHTMQHNMTNQHATLGERSKHRHHMLLAGMHK